MFTVVIFVDSKPRDLMGDALIAYHLEKRGVRVILEPLASWRSCLGAWKPDFILFNHLNADHLARFSQELKSYGVLSGILPNEGIFYVKGDLEFSSRKIFDNMHCNLILSWNDTHTHALIENNVIQSDQIQSIGVPRFDFYSPPWSQLYHNPSLKKSRPVVLVNSNFSCAHFHDLPAKDGDDFFSPWIEEIPCFADYRNAINTHHHAQSQFPQFVDTLIKEDKYDIYVRPHPREDPRIYLNWYASIPDSQKKHLHLADMFNITELILACDLEISCENCTTTLEAWLANKPTVGLTFAKHPMFYTQEVCSMQPECNTPENLPALVDHALANPDQPEFKNDRLAHLEKWIYKPDGKSAERAADAILHAIENRPQPKNIRLSFGTRRRGLKLRMHSAINEPYNSRIKHVTKYKIFGKKGKQTIRYRNYLKAIRPSEVKEAIDSIRHAASQQPAQ